MLMILARLVRSESFWAVAKVRSPHTGPGIRYIIAAFVLSLFRTHVCMAIEAAFPTTCSSLVTSPASSLLFLSGMGSVSAGSVQAITGAILSYSSSTSTDGRKGAGAVKFYRRSVIGDGDASRRALDRGDASRRGLRAPCRGRPKWPARGAAIMPLILKLVRLFDSSDSEILDIINEEVESAIDRSFSIRI